MLRIHQTASVDAAKNYFDDGLRRGDYYVGVEIPGLWQGRGAKMLGLHGEIEKNEFHALCENQRPDRSGKLTARHVANRRVGYDITFNCPKSVSLIHGVIGDGRIMKAFRKSVRETMALIEEDIHVRVRENGKDEDRRTGNLIWGEFVHLKSRPVEGIPDPALHCHAYVFNASYDDVENKWKAGQFFYIKHDAPYYQAVFHSKLAMGLRKLGYGIVNQPFGFEIEGVGQENIRRFSRRTEEIEALADELGLQGDAEAKSQLAARSRQGKRVALTAKQIRDDWLGRLDRESLTYNQPTLPIRLLAGRALDLAIEQCFERRSVVQKRRLIASALQLSLGRCTHTEIERTTRKKESLLTRIIRGFEQVTTREVMHEEEAIRVFLRRTKDSVERLGFPTNSDDEKTLDAGQRSAMEMILRSQDRVAIIEGRAGTGKTTMMSATITAIEEAGLEVFTFAPTSEAAHKVLKQEGFHNAETIQQLLVNLRLQSKMKGKVLWVDEAGLLSSNDMARLIQIIEEQDARLILSGDTRQHHSVERGDALRLIVQTGLVSTASLSQIYRQRRKDYRDAIESLSCGKVSKALSQFDRMGAIHEVQGLEARLEKIAETYLDTAQRNRSMVVVSPTHHEGRLVTHRVRLKLKEAGLLAEEEISQDILRNRNLTVAERRQAVHYRVGEIVKFHRNYRSNHHKGESYVVARITEDERIILAKGDRRLVLDPEAADCFQVYEIHRLALAAGDWIRMTENSATESGKRLFNGSIHQIQSINEEGLHLASGERLRRDFRQIDYGYVSTSHSSQGRTCDHVIVCQSSLSHAAGSLEQFYVSASRGRDNISIYTDDKEYLIRSIQESGKRLLAGDIFGNALPPKHSSLLAKLTAAMRKHKERWLPLDEERALSQRRQALEGLKEQEQGRER